MNICYLNHKKILSLIPDREITAHKGDFGKVLLLCGSIGYTGAAALSANAALRAGSGLVYLGVPSAIYAIEAIKLTEPIVFPLADSNGMLAHYAIEEVSKQIIGKDAILIGPGLGRSDGVYNVVRFVLENFHGPVVVDADGINVLAEHKDILKARVAPTILTPHKVEFERIGMPVSNTKEDRISCATQLAKELGVIILLKGCETVITDGIKCYVNTTGNPGMAVGGSGDVLSGIIVSLLGQGVEPLEATAAAAWLHGKAGDICAEKIGYAGMLPSDMIDALPQLLK